MVMRSAEHGWVTIVMRVVAAVGLAFLALPLLMTIPLSVEPGSMLRFPPQSISWHWYSDYLNNGAWMAATALSFKVAAGASVLATIVGTLAALGLARAPSRLRDVATLVLLSPIFLPTIVVAIAVYGVYASLRLVGTPVGLMLAHAVLTIPFVILNVSTALAAVPRTFEEAAQSLGAGPLATFFQVTVPLIGKGIAAGAVFSFLTSFDEVVIAMFLSGTRAVTLPKKMLDGVFYEMTPMLAAISVLLIAMNVVLALTGLALARKREVPPAPAAPA
jgi:putative spermidine/putrescine transport system permease protein